MVPAAEQQLVLLTVAGMEQAPDPVADAPRFAVLGSPIAHSLSPALHRAAFAVQGLDWAYGRAEVDAAGLPAFWSGLGAEWRGLSLTMPLKRAVLPLLDGLDSVAERLGAVNTVRFDGGRALGWNTDVPGAVAALTEAGVGAVRRVLLFGGGATAASLLLATHAIGAEQVLLLLRDPAKAGELRALAAGLGVGLEVLALADAVAADGLAGRSADLVVNTIPAVAGFTAAVPPELLRVPLFEASYSPWPSPAAALWQAQSSTVVPGIELLIHQALLQQRIFVGADAARPLPDEPAVLSALRAAADSRNDQE